MGTKLDEAVYSEEVSGFFDASIN